MRIYELFHSIVNKFVPMEETTKLELQSGALQWYNKNKDDLAIIEAENIQALKYNDEHRNDEDFQPRQLRIPTMKNKIFQLLEQWWLRYLIALLFIFLVPKVKAFINGEPGQTDDDDDDDDDGGLSEFMAYQRFKKSMK